MHPAGSLTHGACRGNFANDNQINGDGALFIRFGGRETLALFIRFTTQVADPGGNGNSALN